MVIAQFRADFPEFTDPVRYPDSQITFWSTIATKMVRECIWKDMYSTAIELYTAHELVLASQNLQASNNGGTPGTASGGTAQSKTVGSVSVSYDTNNTSEKDAGWYNLTVYGKQYYRLMMIFGAGGIQL